MRSQQGDDYLRWVANAVCVDPESERLVEVLLPTSDELVDSAMPLVLDDGSLVVAPMVI